jgi:hypothetical protein
MADSYDMLSNSTVATAIINSFKANETGAIDTMFRDLQSADPYRFFDASGVPIPGFFEVNADIAGSGSWLLTENDVIEVKLKLIFNSRVTRRGVAGREHNLTSTATENNTSAQENQQTIIKPNDYFYIRLQLKSTLTASAGGTGSEIVTANVNTAIQSLGTSVTSTELSTFLGSFTASNPAPAPVITVQDMPITSLVTTAASSFDTTQTYDVNFVLLTDNTVTIDTTPLAVDSVVYIPIQTNTPTTLIVDGISYSMTKSGTSVIINGTTYSLGSTVDLGNKTFRIAFSGSLGLVVGDNPPPPVATGWAASIVSEGYDTGFGSAVDLDGNVYASSFSSGSNNITINNFISGGDGGIVNVSSYGIMSGSNNNTLIIVKYNSSGLVQWATRLTGVSTNENNDGGIATDGAGNVYVYGNYYSNLEIFNFSSGGNGSSIITTTYGVLPINGTNTRNAYIIKYNTNGVAQWATRITRTGSGTVFVGKGLAVDINGNVYLVGRFSNSSVTIENFQSVGNDGTISTTSYGTISNSAESYNYYDDSFIVKYNTNGIALWATSLSGPKFDIASSIAVDSSGNVYIVGTASSNLTTFRNFVSGGNGGEILTSSYGTLSSSPDIYNFILVKYNTNGIVQWATKIIAGDSGWDRAQTIKTDKFNNVYIGGQFRANPISIHNFISGGNGGTISTSLYGTLSNSAGNSGMQAFIIKYNTNGVAQWALCESGDKENYMTQIALDYEGNVYACGYFTSSSLTINSFASGGNGGAITMTSYGTMQNTGVLIGREDGFIVKYDKNGIAQWATRITGTRYERVFGISVDAAGSAYLTGYFSSLEMTINAFSSGGNGGPITMTTYGKLTGNDDKFRMFIIKYNRNGKFIV